MKALLQPFDNRYQRFDIRRIAGPHFTADRLPLVVNHRAHNHLFQIRAVILAKPPLAERFSATAFKVNGGRIEKNKVQLGEQISAIGEHGLLYPVLVATG